MTTPPIPAPYPVNGGFVKSKVLAASDAPTSSTPADFIGQEAFVQTTPPSYYKNYGYDVSEGFIWKQVYPGQTIVTPPVGALYFDGTAVQGYPLTGNNQVLGTDGAGNPAAATIVAGTGISIIQSGPVMTVTNTSIGAVTSWASVAVNTALNVSEGYITTTAATLTLPATASLGATIVIVALVAGVVIAQGAGQQIQYPSATATPALTTAGAAGSYTSAVAGAVATLICCNNAGTLWLADISGNWIAV